MTTQQIHTDMCEFLLSINKTITQNPYVIRICEQALKEALRQGVNPHTDWSCCKWRVTMQLEGHRFIKLGYKREGHFMLLIWPLLEVKDAYFYSTFINNLCHLQNGPKQ